MSDMSNSDARKRLSCDPPPVPDDAATIDCGNPSCNWKFVLPEPLTPRVARSIDDLRVGQVVAWYDGGEWDADALEDADDVAEFRSGWPEQVVILADPPAPPAADWLVPADTMAELEDALIERTPQTDPKRHRTVTVDWMWLTELQKAARSVLDAAREVERDE